MKFFSLLKKVFFKQKTKYQNRWFCCQCEHKIKRSRPCWWSWRGTSDKSANFYRPLLGASKRWRQVEKGEFEGQRSPAQAQQLGHTSRSRPKINHKKFGAKMLWDLIYHHPDRMTGGRLLVAPWHVVRFFGQKFIRNRGSVVIAQLVGGCLHWVALPTLSYDKRFEKYKQIHVYSF